MANISSYQKKLCMTELTVQHSSISSNTFFECADNSRLNASFVFIKKGKVEVNCGSKIINLTEGDLFYIPDKLAYSSKWYGDNQIDYYTFLATSTSPSNENQQNYDIQVIDKLSKEYLEQVFEKVFTLMSSNERVDKIKAISIYYDFYAKVLPLLKFAKKKEYHPAIIKALNYINKNFNINYSTKDLAKYCFLSESHIYHLFKKEVGIGHVAYRNEKRIQEATKLLLTDMPIEDISEKVGFNSTSYFFETFKAYTNLTPNVYRQIIMSSEK